MTILECFEDYASNRLDEKIDVINFLAPFEQIPDEGFVLVKSFDSLGFSVYVIYSVNCTLNRVFDVQVFRSDEFGLASLAFYLLSRDIKNIPDVMRYCVDLIEDGNDR